MEDLEHKPGGAPLEEDELSPQNRINGENDIIQDLEFEVNHEQSQTIANNDRESVYKARDSNRRKRHLLNSEEKENENAFPVFATVDSPQKEDPKSFNSQIRISQ